jgi:hypothetical protein
MLVEFVLSEFLFDLYALRKRKLIKKNTTDELMKLCIKNNLSYGNNKVYYKL